MSCIVGIVENGNVYMGADSAAVIDANMSYKICENEKIFTKDNMVFGVAGSLRVIQIIRYSFKIPPKEEDCFDDREYMSSTFVRELRSALVENGCVQVQDEREHFDVEFLIGYNGNLYHVDSDMAVTQAVDYDAAGIGDVYALSSLHVLSKFSVDVDPVDKLGIALETAEKFSMCVKSPFSISILEKSAITSIADLEKS